MQWGPSAQALSIAAKELIPIILACAAWGSTWHGQRVLCHCDNQVVVACLRSRTSKDTGVMHLLRCLVFIEAYHHCHLHPMYIDTRSNHLADDLSRDNLFSFFHKVPGADVLATGSVGRLDLNALAPSVQRYFQSGLAPSTQATYKAATKRFYLFCIAYNVFSPFPLTEQLLCSFAAFLADQQLAPQTVKSYLSTLRNTQISLGLPDPTDQSSMPVLRRVQAGISRLRMIKGSRPASGFPSRHTC